VKVAGTDATKQFDSFHNLSVLDKVGAEYCVGEIGGADKPDRGLPTTKTVAATQIEDSAECDPYGDLVPFGDPLWYQEFYSPYYKDSHRRLRAFMREFVDAKVMPFCHEWDENKRIPKELFQECAKAGILPGVTGGPWNQAHSDAPPPAGIKPEEFDVFHELIICDELSRCGSGGVLWGLIGGLGIGLPPIVHFASDELRMRVVPPCLNGDKAICLAITEPHAGSDVAGLKTEARKTEDGKHYILNGEKKWITNGTFADYFTVAVRTGGEGMGGVSLLLVERTMPGVKTKQMNCSGVWSSGTAYITFEDVKVPVENLIGKENKGFKYIMENFNHERMGIVIQANRFARVCYEESLKYAHKRKTFGKRLVDHPVIRNKLAHMARQIEATHAWMEAMIYQTLHLPKEIQAIRLGGPIALLKAQATQTFEYCAREAAQIFGGLAYTRGGQGEKIERLYREVRAYAIPGGSEEIMLDFGIRQSVAVGKMMGAKL